MEIVIPQVVLHVPEWTTRVGLVVAAMAVGGACTAVYYEHRVARMFVAAQAQAKKFVGRI